MKGLASDFSINGGKVERETYGTSDVALGGKGAARCLERDMFYTLALDSRERGNKVVLESKYRVAIGHHSETILQFRPLVTETDCMWDDAACLMVRELSATAYLNLSLCSSRRSGGLTPCTRQLTQKGDSRPPDPRDATLPSVKGAKALFRRALAQYEGFGNVGKAREDLRRALGDAPPIMLPGCRIRMTMMMVHDG